MTVQEALQHSDRQLQQVYPPSESAAITAWLLEWISGIPRQQRSLHRQALLNEAQMQKMDQALTRLLAHEPIQYITGQAWFCGLLFYVNKHVLIPRPETEELVEWVISNCRFPLQQTDILDIGSGSGCIPLSLKKRLSKASVVSCDISHQALEVARHNSLALGIPVTFLQLNFLDPGERAKLGVYDFIVSNPPYIPFTEKDQLDPNVAAYEPALALFVPDTDPLLFYRAIAEFGQDHLKPGGMILAEMHAQLAGKCELFFQEMGYTTETRTDMQGKTRMLRCSLIDVR